MATRQKLPGEREHNPAFFADFWLARLLPLLSRVSRAHLRHLTIPSLAGRGAARLMIQLKTETFKGSQNR